MLKNMLKAVSVMLKESKDPKVECAKTIVDEIIKGIDPEAEDQIVDVALPPFKDSSYVIPAAKKKPGRPAKEIPNSERRWEVIVNEGKLVQVTGLPDDAMLELDGAPMTHAQAKGRSFQNATIL